MAGKSDKLFSTLEAWHGDGGWGSVLDAGTGEHSLGWITELPTDRWTAVTADSARATALEDRFGPVMRVQDRVVFGNWADPAFLAGERYDVVVADYLIGAVDGFSPYFQEGMIRRLVSMTAKRLYIVGLEPYPERSAGAGGELILEIARVRDACILLGRHRCYREYPLRWMMDQLERAGMVVERVASFPIRYGESFVKGQLGICRQKFPLMDVAVAFSLGQYVDALQSRALRHIAEHGPIVFGEDNVVAARVRDVVQ